ncbi:MAG: sensor histidine kinase [Ardenticatenaceae bacterium]|nr:sensor histidine kinase [Ardenticatenaceae bacterium]
MINDKMAWMDNIPLPRFLNTFRFAMSLKLVGVGVALIIGRLTLYESIFDRWWSVVVATSFILIWLLPWPARLAQQSFWTHIQVIFALFFALTASFVEIIQASWVPFAALLENPYYVTRFNWTPEQSLGIHALGLIFVIVPVVLASWQYGKRGFWLSQMLAGVYYVSMPVFLPAGAFTWGIYAVRGFVLLGTSLIVASIVYTLSEAEHREQAALSEANSQLAAANEKLARQSLMMEELAVNRERNRLSREMHDTLSHSLSAASIQLQAIGTLFQVDPAAAENELQAAQETIRRGLKESRRAIRALRSSPLDELGLTAAIQLCASHITNRSAISIACRTPEGLPALPQPVEQALYRITEEVLHNAERHSAASEIDLLLTPLEDQETIQLIIRDNGVGFDVPVALASDRFGLQGIRERAEIAGGRLHIHSQPGNGCCIEASFPLANPEV